MTSPIGTIPTMRIAPPAGVTFGDTAGKDFGSALQSALHAAIDTGHTAETASLKSINGGGNLTEVATALSHAELTLQTATAIRDRMLQAYQDIMRIPI